jgi:hypothetical protein
MSFIDAQDFENKLLATARPLLSPYGQVVTHQRLGTRPDGSAREIDLVFMPASGSYAGRPILIEVKYSKTPTLPQATLLAEFQRFDSIRMANTGLNSQFALVTNGIVARTMHDIDTDIKIFDNISDIECFERELRNWLL